ncbi:CHASE2 domain-containing protein [Scytonema sp. UIC 10036]|uniref:CHASE2 domain-containing protein n=1 Tax=Scytonema sp. UIC 10036 TaxID=2304196 RepID=UPI0012DA95C1|nr:CHASE2 domain-containing protein [Scytonema sp. UIC 10036]MUG97661.1 CHASE2 domain-containing protein [Scytonema sp. UIC 10036]
MNNFYLKIQKVDRTCLFELSWGKNQHITAALFYPEDIILSHNEWHKIYCNFYSNQLRGKVVNKGIIAPPPVDLQAKLVQAEAKFLYEFHQWLRSKELHDIRIKLSKQALEQINKSVKDNSLNTIDIFISCNCSELEHLPWEAWEISTEFAPGNLRIVRQPLNIRQEGANLNKKSPRKARFLAIFGDETGLSFEEELRSVESLKKQASVEVLRWKPNQDINEFKNEIVTLLTTQNWDIVFFAGHSNETTFTGGQLSIAPNVTIALSEIEKPLSTAIANGLQFALFNSCDGLSIANKLIDLGLSQVAIMREKVHNRVAGEFFVQFLNAIKEYKDVHEALLAATDYLKTEKNLTYPSAYLIPSLFRHPNAELFRLKPFGIQHQIINWLPTRRETLALGTLVILSLLPPVQEALLDFQVGMQAVYRNVTKQLPSETSPPVLLIHIDEASLNEAGTKAHKFNPIDRSYFAKIIDKLTTIPAKVVGVDYLFDRVTDDDTILATSVKNSINKNGTWFIFGAQVKNNQEQGVHKSVANLNQALQGYVDKSPGYLSLVSRSTDCIQSCPFTYLTALVALLNQEKTTQNLLQPQLSRNNDLRTDLIKDLGKLPENSSLTQKLQKLRLSRFTNFSESLGQLWLYPIIDYSLPPNQVYQVINAKDFLRKDNTTLNQDKLKQQVVLIGAGGYEEAGLSKFHSDTFPLPMGVAYWRSQNSSSRFLQDFTGVEINAYMIQNLLKQHLIIPIPDMWMIGIAAFLGKYVQLLLAQHQHTKRRCSLFMTSLAGGTGIYALISMQMYVSASLLVPLFLPSATFWIYALFGLRNHNDK